MFDLRGDKENDMHSVSDAVLSKFAALLSRIISDALTESEGRNSSPSALWRNLNIARVLLLPCMCNKTLRMYVYG